MRHRGPDENEAWWDDRAVFGFNRLSFIDIEHSHQPMPYADGRYRIVFNGEIYNYLELRAELAAEGATFATEGDTEAIVAGYHLWGEDVVPRLRGMFAFVIWDTQTQHGRSAPATRSASSRCSPPAWPTAGWSSAPRRRPLLELLGGSKAAGGVDPALAAALPDAAVRPGAGDPAPRHPPDRERHELHGRRTASCTRSATSTRRSRSGRWRRTRSRRSTTGSPTSSTTRCGCTCGPTSRSARSSPAASTPPPSPPWPSGTTRTC